VIVTGVELKTTEVVISKLTVLAPADTVTDAGTVAAGLLLFNATMAPPVGAGAVRVMVPIEPVPPMTAVGLTLTELRAAGTGLTVKVAVWFTDA